MSAAGEAALALDGEGLRLFLLPSGSSRLLAFGTTDEAALGTISTVLDAAPVEEAFSEDCQARLARWENGLTTWFADDHFVGWSTGALGEGLTTPTGVGVGSTRAQVESSYQLQVFQSTLGTEFTAGGMAGLFESAEPNARVLVLWAGQTCIAR